MGLTRKPFQGVLNILRFNWHFYLGAGAALLACALLQQYLPEPLRALALGLSGLAALTLLLSLAVSCYVYDGSDLYQLGWLSEADHKRVLNIHAGFDETSEIIQRKFPRADLTICDFYDPAKHTEISIRRARRAYPPLAGTLRVSTRELPFPDSSFDFSLAILSAHEIRDEQERIGFFRELGRVSKPGGQILVTEHLRDWRNFMAYTIGFFHFHSPASWSRTFEGANLRVEQAINTTPFITTYLLKKNGNTL